MRFKSKKAQAIILTISILLSIIVSLFVVWGSPILPIAFGKDYPFEEDYNRYKGYADIYVETFDKESIETDELFNIQSNIEKDYIEIIVDGTVSKVVAKYPIKVQNGDNNNITIIIEDATYENYSNVKSAFNYILLLIGLVVLEIFVFLVIVNTIHDAINWIILKIKQKKHKEDNN